MPELELPIKVYNIELLDRDLKAALTPQVCFGVTGRKDKTYVILADNAPEGSTATATSIATAHDSAQRTDEQQARVEREAKLQVAIAKLESVDVKPAADVRTVAELAAIVDVLQTQLEWALIKLHALTGEALPEKRQ